MQLNHVIEMSLIEAENEGLSKQERDYSEMCHQR